MPKDLSNDNDPALPFPGDYDTETGFPTQYIRLATLTNPQLSEHCKTFRLPHTGNKTALVNRLKEFSGDRAQWDRLIPGATNTHKGMRKASGERKTKLKASVTRRETLFSGTNGVRVAQVPATDRSKDTRTAADKAKIKPWAEKILAQYPYDPEALNINRSLYVQQAAPSSTSAPFHSPGQVRLNDDHAAPLGTPPQDFFPAQVPSAVNEPAGDQDVHMSSPSPPPPPSIPFSSSLPPPSDNAPTRSLVLSGGKILTFSESDVPDPPAVSYAHRGIGSLLSEWDDESPGWAERSSLVIKGVPVPVKYWPRIYKYWKVSQWDGVKKNWFDWKTLVSAITSAPSTDEFWAKYSAPGRDGVPQRMKYTPLLTRLTQERKADDERVAAIARQELTAEQLTYRKGGQHFVMKKASKIAARYRELKGLGQNKGDDDEGEDDN